MKFSKFYKEIWWGWLFIFPTIILKFNEEIYINPNFRISIHWLGFHASWLWIKEDEVLEWK